MAWRDVNPHVRFEVRHVVPHLVNRYAAGHAFTPGLRVERAENQVRRRAWTISRERVDQAIHLCFVDDERLADDAQTARLAQEHQSDRIAVNHEHQLTAGIAVAARRRGSWRRQRSKHQRATARPKCSEGTSLRDRQDARTGNQSLRVGPPLWLQHRAVLVRPVRSDWNVARNVTRRRTSLRAGPMQFELG